jgi:hypothetical protein
MAGQWFSPGTWVSSLPPKSDCHNTIEILLKASIILFLYPQSRMQTLNENKGSWIVSSFNSFQMLLNDLWYILMLFEILKKKIKYCITAFLDCVVCSSINDSDCPFSIFKLFLIKYLKHNCNMHYAATSVRCLGMVSSSCYISGSRGWYYPKSPNTDV